MPRWIQRTSTARIQAPRVSRNPLSSRRPLPRSVWMRAEMPARNTNAGAQKWVIQRVAKTAGAACTMSVPMMWALE